MHHALAALAIATAATLAQAGVVEVSFVHPEKYTDIGRGRDADQAQASLARHLERLGQKLLPAQRSLAIEVLDVDLAGEQRLSARRWSDTRILRGTVDWPQLKLRYTLREGGQVIGQGEEVVKDINYLQSIRPTRAGDDAILPYEKHMLTAWFSQRFGAQP